MRQAHKGDQGAVDRLTKEIKALETGSQRRPGRGKLARKGDQGAVDRVTKETKAKETG